MRFSPPLPGPTPGLGTTAERMSEVRPEDNVGANKVHKIKNSYF